MANYSPTMEETLLSCVLKDPALFPVLKDLVNSSDFFWYPHKWIWTSLINLSDAEKHIDMVTLVDEMERSGDICNYVSAYGGLKGLDALNKLKEIEEANTNHAESYARSIKDDSSRRKILEVLNKGEKWVSDSLPSLDILNRIEQELNTVSTYSGAKSSYLVSASDGINIAREATMKANKGGGVSVLSGLIDLDKLIGGFFPGDLNIIAARAGEGKTALLLTISANAAINNLLKKKKVGIFSMEMSTGDLINRFISQYTGISATNLRSGNLKDDDWEKYEQASEKISKAGIYIDDTPALTIPEMRTKVRKMKENGIDLIIADQLDLMNAQMSNAKEFEKINWLSYRLKELAREFNVPFLVAHQLNRGIEQQAITSRTPQRNPQLSDLEQAGEKATDMVLMIRHTKENNVIQRSFIHIVKNRNGPTDVAEVKFIGNRTKFESIDKNSVLPPGMRDNE